MTSWYVPDPPEEDSTKMDIERNDFDKHLPALLKGLEEADFVAIDFEFSGMAADPKLGKVERNRKPTLAERYKELKDSAEKYCIMQVGICLINWDPVGMRYITRPFNFFVAPHVNHKLRYDRVFSFTSEAISFHVKHGFDFNKMYGRGCLYLGHEEEAYVRELKRQRDESVFKDIPVDPDELPMLDAARKAITAWNEKRDGDSNDFINVEPFKKTERGFNGYQRRILHQMLRTEFPDLVGMPFDRHFQVVPLNQEREKMVERKRAEEFEKVIAGQRGVRILFDKIMELKKPVVGHNLFTDLCYMHHMFIGKLPDDIEDFRKFLQQKFGLIADTKFLALNSDRSTMGSVSSGLQELSNKLVNQELPRIDQFTGVHDKLVQDHVAGYDAWITARVFIKLATRMYHAGSDNPPMPMETSACLDKRKKDIEEALTVRPPRLGYSKMVDLEKTPDVAIIPRLSSKFWTVFGNRLIVNGTIEGEFTL